MGVKLLVGVVWLLSWLPFRAISALGWLVGSLIYLLPTSRRHIGEVNLRLCLPELDEPARRRLLRRHFVAMVQMLLEYGYGWFASQERLKRFASIQRPSEVDIVGVTSSGKNPVPESEAASTRPPAALTQPPKSSRPAASTVFEGKHEPAQPAADNCDCPPAIARLASQTTSEMLATYPK